MRTRRQPSHLRTNGRFDRYVRRLEQRIETRSRKRACIALVVSWVMAIFAGDFS